MDKVWKFLTGPFGSWVRVVLGFGLFALLTLLQNGGSLTDIDLEWWQHTLDGALGAVLPVIIAAVNPQDVRFGTGS